MNNVIAFSRTSEPIVPAGCEQFETPVPDGYDTVWGFLLREEPFVLDIMMDPIQAGLSDQRRARIISDCLGETFKVVVAPPALLSVGVKEVFAFTTSVLRETYPVNP